MAGLSVRVEGMWQKDSGRTGGVGVIVSVTHADGSPVTGLVATDFGVYTVDNPSAKAHQSANLGAGAPAGPVGFQELPGPPEGLYSMGTGSPGPTYGGGWGSDVIVILVEVESGNDRGRAMTNVEF